MTIRISLLWLVLAAGVLGCGVGRATDPASCQVGGCSGQLCFAPGNDLASTCEWRNEYACYRTARCERQAGGACGWTSTPELQQCLEAARKVSSPPVE